MWPWEWQAKNFSREVSGHKVAGQMAVNFSPKPFQIPEWNQIQSHETETPRGLKTKILFKPTYSLSVADDNSHDDSIDSYSLAENDGHQVLGPDAGSFDSSPQDGWSSCVDTPSGKGRGTWIYSATVLKCLIIMQSVRWNGFNYKKIWTIWSLTEDIRKR